MIDAPEESTNVIAEIQGGRKKDEVVIIGSAASRFLAGWHGRHRQRRRKRGDDGGDAHPEVARPETATAPSGWACGAAKSRASLGSRAYVKEHFADPEVMKLTSQHAKVAGYFNYDNGTARSAASTSKATNGRARSSQQWIEPFRDLGADRVTIRNTGGTDHLSFDAVGLPGFQFIQDPLEYDRRTHHSNMDVYDRVQKGDLMQAAAVMASFVYNTAMREEMLPRKYFDVPAPAPQRRDN